MIKVTVRCSFCTHPFAPIADPALGDLVMLDNAGKLCCDDCLHPRCGFGHAFESEADTCESLMDMCDPYDEVDGYGDPDAACDRLRDMADLELTS